MEMSIARLGTIAENVEVKDSKKPSSKLKEFILTIFSELN